MPENEKAGRMAYDRGGFRGRVPPHSRGAIDVFVVTETRTDGVHLEGAIGKVCTVHKLSKALVVCIAVILFFDAWDPGRQRHR